MTLTSFAGILSLALMTGGLQPQEAPPLPMDKRHGWIEERAVPGDVAQRKSRGSAFVLRAELMPDSSPSRAHDTLYEREAASGDLRRVAERVEGALEAPDGTLFFVQKSALFALKGDYPRKLLDRSTGDLTFDHAGRHLALVRLGEDGDPTAIDLVNREGKVERRLAAREGMLWLPIFTPDGKSVVYLSSETGFASFWRVDLDGTNRRQLTNLNITSDAGGVFSQDFVPPAERREAMRFVSPTHLEYASGNEVWQLDIETGKAWRASSVPSGQEGAEP